MPFMAFMDDAEPMAGDESPVTDEMWATVCLSVCGKVKALFDEQKPPEGLDVECDGDGKARVFAIWRKMHPDLAATPGALLTTRDFAAIHSTIQADLSRTRFGICRRVCGALPPTTTPWSSTTRLETRSR